MKDLTDLIKNKAASKLQNEINEYLRAFIDHKFFDAITDFKVKVMENGAESERDLRGFLWNYHGAAHDAIIEKFEDKYIEQESIEFMDKVESLQKDVQDLFNNQPSEY